MAFYSEFAKYYDLAFPFDQTVGNFLRCHLKKEISGGNNILDIACGTGAYTAYLAEDKINICGLDADSEMIYLANKRVTKNNIKFVQGNMLNLQTDLDYRIFHGVYCIGNSIVHLESDKEIGLFLYQCRRIMPAGGTLIIQTINFDRILDQNIKTLPTLDSEEIGFKRNYSFLDKDHISFDTRITIKKDGKLFLNSIPLVSLRKKRLAELLGNAGFQIKNSFGSYSEENWETESFLTILICEASVPIM